MPLLYGEGKKKAFRRLQEEIVKSSTDLSIFLWKAPNELEDNSTRPYWDLLADDPKWFSALPLTDWNQQSIQLQDASMDINNQGRKVKWSLMPFTNEPTETVFLVMLRGFDGASIGIALQQLDTEGTQFCRVSANRLFWMRSWLEDQVFSDDKSLSLDLDLSLTDIIPKRQSCLRRFENTPVSLPPAARGVSFTPSQLEDASRGRIKLVDVSFHFGQDVSGRVCLALIFSDPTRAVATGVRQAKAVGAFHITAGTPGESLMCDAWVVVGIDVLLNTLLDTPNLFVQPWLAIIPRRRKRLRAHDACTEAELLDQAQRRTTVFSYGMDEETCCLKIETVTRINGMIWYDIKAEMSNRSRNGRGTGPHGILSDNDGYSGEDSDESHSEYSGPFW